MSEPTVNKGNKNTVKQRVYLIEEFTYCSLSELIAITRRKHAKRREANLLMSGFVFINHYHIAEVPLKGIIGDSRVHSVAQVIWC